MTTTYPEFFPSFNFYRRRGGELQENFEKDALFYEGTQKLQKIMTDTVAPSQGLLSMTVDYRRYDRPVEEKIDR